MIRWKSFNAIFESGADALAIYKGKTMIQFSHEMSKGAHDRVHSMIWEDIKRKYNIDESDLRK